MMKIQQIASQGPLYEACKTLRNAVLRHPLGLVLTPQELALDAERDHLVAVLDGAVVGTVSFYLETPTRLRIKQMAVDPSHQGHGIGAQLMQAVQACAHELGATALVLHARSSAISFYEKQQFVVQGAEFLEQGIAHRVMTKQRVPSKA